MRDLPLLFRRFENRYFSVLFSVWDSVGKFVDQKSTNPLDFIMIA